MVQVVIVGNLVEKVVIFAYGWTGMMKGNLLST